MVQHDVDKGEALGRTYVHNAMPGGAAMGAALAAGGYFAASRLGSRGRDIQARMQHPHLLGFCLHGGAAAAAA